MSLSKFDSLVRVAGQLGTITGLLSDYDKWINHTKADIDDPKFTEFLQHFARVLTRASVVVQDAAAVHSGRQLPTNPSF